jgi:hypothetical protein
VNWPNWPFQFPTRTFALSFLITSASGSILIWSGCAAIAVVADCGNLEPTHAMQFSTQQTDFRGFKKISLIYLIKIAAEQEKTLLA